MSSERDLKTLGELITEGERGPEDLLRWYERSMAIASRLLPQGDRILDQLAKVSFTPRTLYTSATARAATERARAIGTSQVVSLLKVIAGPPRARR